MHLLTSPEQIYFDKVKNRIDSPKDVLFSTTQFHFII